MPKYPILEGQTPFNYEAHRRAHEMNVPPGLGDDMPAFSTVKTGELAGSTTATQMPDVTCRMVKFKAHSDNAGKVYIGASGVTKADGTTDTTTGLQLIPGEESAWLPVINLNVFYRISDNAGDDLTYLALA